MSDSHYHRKVFSRHYLPSKTSVIVSLSNECPSEKWDEFFVWKIYTMYEFVFKLICNSKYWYTFLLVYIVFVIFVSFWFALYLFYLYVLTLAFSDTNLSPLREAAAYSTRRQMVYSEIVILHNFKQCDQHLPKKVFSSNGNVR